MSEKKIIAVVGATGAQGGGVVRAIQNDPAGGFTARAITRDVNSPAARQLAALGAEQFGGSQHGDQFEFQRETGLAIPRQVVPV